ncbi:Syntaxin-41 [Zea mays]|nr:Syntaxin-41 [Zea mays]
MNMNGTKSTFEDDEFDDVVRFILVFTCCIPDFGDSFYLCVFDISMRSAYGL